MNDLPPPMLWQDDDPRTDFAEKVRRGARYYEQKHGVLPNVVLVRSPSAKRVRLDATDESSPAITVRRARHVLPICFQFQVEAEKPL